MARTFEQKYDELPDDDLSSILGQAFDDFGKSIRVMLPCEIVSISPDYKTVNVKILDKDVDNSGNIIDYPIVTNCPIKHPANTGSAYIHVLPAIGDQGDIGFFDSNIDDHFINDNPKFDDNEEWHHLSNGIYTNGYSSKSKSISLDPNAKIAIGLKSGTVVLKFKDDALYLEGDMFIDGDLDVSGSIKAGNGATGTYTNSVTATDGIVTSGS